MEEGRIDHNEAMVEVRQLETRKVPQNDYLTFKEITCWGCPNSMGPTIDTDNSEKVRKKGVQ